MQIEVSDSDKAELQKALEMLLEADRKLAPFSAVIQASVDSVGMMIEDRLTNEVIDRLEMNVASIGGYDFSKTSEALRIVCDVLTRTTERVKRT